MHCGSSGRSDVWQMGGSGYMGARGLMTAVAVAGLAAVMGSASAQSQVVSAGRHGLVGAAAGRAAEGGAISTVAGGVGGPARATTVSLWSPPGAVHGNQSIGCVPYASQARASPTTLMRGKAHG